MAHRISRKKKKPERQEIDPIDIGAYVKAIRQITYKKPGLTIPKNTRGIVHARKSRHKYEIVWPQDFEHARVTNENSITRV